MTIAKYFYGEACMMGAIYFLSALHMTKDVDSTGKFEQQKEQN